MLLYEQSLGETSKRIQARGQASFLPHRRARSQRFTTLSEKMPPAPTVTKYGVGATAL